MATGNPITLSSPPAKAAPYVGAIAIDVSAADQNLTTNSRAIVVGVGGTLKVDFIDGTTVTFTGLTAGTLYPFCVKKVYFTGTTATGCVALL